MPNQNARGFIGKFNIQTTRQFANNIYFQNNETPSSEPIPPDEGFLIQDNGFDILQDNGFPILYTA